MVKNTQPILIVEDNEMNMRLFDDLLRAHGYDTVKSVNGMDVVELAREHSPDLIIMDILLPVLSGIELTRMLKAEIDLKSIPVIALTASIMKGGEEVIFEAGCDAFVTKPVSIPLLLDSISRLIPTGRLKLANEGLLGAIL